jgi:hypothetical protein
VSGDEAAVIELKKGISLNGVQAPVLFGLMVLDGVIALHSVPTVVTSCTEGKTHKGLAHYVGAAVDVRSRELTISQQNGVKAAFDSAQNGEMDLVIEKDHFHLEWDRR